MMSLDFLEKIRIDRQSEISHIESGVISLLDGDMKNIKAVNEIRIKLNKLNMLIDSDYNLISSYLRDMNRCCEKAVKVEKIAKIKEQISDLQTELRNLEEQI